MLTTMKKCMSKYDFDPSTMLQTGIDYSEVVTVPDQVLSMYDIYMKYASRGEIAGLANNIRPHTVDDLDMFDESVDFVPEEDVDILQRSSELRLRQPSDRSDSEDKPQEKEESTDSVSKPQEPATKPEDSGSGSE